MNNYNRKEMYENDRKLYEEFLNGNQEAFNVLVKKYRNDLLKFVEKYIQDREVAEDIVQDVFIYIFVTKKHYDFEYAFKTYLYTIAKSRVINYLKQRKEVLSLDENIKLDNVELEESLIKKEEKEHLLKIIDTLKPEYKTVIYLRDLEGYSYLEICKIMNKSLSQVKMLLYRSRKNLSKKMKNSGGKTKLKGRMFVNIFIIMMCLTGFVYAGITVYKYVQRETKTDFTNNPEYDDYNQDMTYCDGLYYKVISSYNSYIANKKKWLQLVEMEEKDFEKYFVVVIAGENYDTTGLYVSNITNDEKNLFIDLNKKEKWDGSTVISVKVEKEMYRDSVIIRNNPNVPDTVNKFIPMEEIPLGYEKEKAIEDGCFVIEYDKVISNDKNKLKEFIENANNGVDGFIRIYDFTIDECATVIDIECKNKTINMSQCNKTNPGNYTVYNSGNSIKNSGGMYWLVDEIGNQKGICSSNL